jgi:hypothetical protein
MLSSLWGCRLSSIDTIGAPTASVATNPYPDLASALDLKVSLSPVHKLFDKPPSGPINHWDAPWNDPQSCWWTVGKWVVNPIGQAVATGLEISGMGLEALSDLAYDLGNTEAGLYFDLGAGAAKLAAGFANPQGALIGMVQGGYAYGAAYSAATGDAIGGFFAGIGQVTGINGLYQAYTRTDLITGEHLSDDQVDERFFSGLSAFAGALAFGMSMTGIDVCIDGCFVAGTQEVLHETDEDDAAAQDSHALMNFSGQSTSTAIAKRYLTQNVELLLEDHYILSKDENDPDGPLVPRRVKQVYIRKVPAIQLLTLRSSCGQIHVICTTREHPFYLDSQGFLRCAILRAGDQVREAGGGFSRVIDSRLESKPEGILVYNVEVEGYHTYFVRAEGSTAEPVWVHNYTDGGEGAGSTTGSIDYGKLDELGRPTGIKATITRDMIDTGTHADVDIEPPGWRGDGIKYNEARGHLLARQLGGSGDIAENLVTIEQHGANTPTMRNYETAVRRAVENGEVVRYSVTPVYNGNALIPHEIVISARGSNGFRLDVRIHNPAAG